jgi:DNA polymerase III subunit delta'
MAWEQIRGQHEAHRQLLATFHAGRLGHTYLFVGPDGVGKHRFAREFAKVLLCEASTAPFTACDHCPACAQVEAGTHPDFSTFRKPDDKQELPVDVAREIVASLGLKPVRGPGKVSIVENADDLNEESSNCLLKTLEEPPPGAVLILIAITSEGQLPTIQSRCQVVRFNPLGAAELKLVLLDQGISDLTLLERAIRSSGGRAGRALELCDDTIWQFHQTILTILASSRPDPNNLAAKTIRFVEEVGTEGAVQRPRASLAIQLISQILHLAFRLSLGANVPEVQVSERPKYDIIASIGADTIADQIEACAEAEYYVERMVQVVLLLEQLAVRVCKR